MEVNRPYTFELAHGLLAARAAGEDCSQHYVTAARNGVTADQLDRAAEVLARLAPNDFDSWIRHEYIVDGWLQGYLPLAASSDDPTLTTWKLGQFADAHYRAGA